MFDASGHVVLPGLINTHHHFYQTLTRACPPALDKALFPWLVALYPVWARLTPDALHLAARVALAELLLSGTTTTSDHHYLFTTGLDHAIDLEIEEARALGIRLVATRGSMSLGVDDGGLPPMGVVQREEVILRDSERLIGRYHEAGEDAMIQVALAPCSPFSVTESIMAQSAALAERHGVRLHTHLAETQDEEAWCRQHFGCRPVDYLERVGWLSDRVWLAHGIWFDDGEVARLGKAKVAVSHCPTSNMILASGCCRVPALEAAGAPVGLGVDGSASNDSSNLIEAVRHAFLLGADKLDHVIYVYQEKGRWGSIARSRDPGLNGRLPGFRSARALAASYVDPYVDYSGRVLAFAVVNLVDEMDGYDWRLTSKNVWKVEQMLIDSFEHAEADFAARLLIEARNEAESVITATEKSMRAPEFADIAATEFAAGEQLRIEQALAGLKRVLTSDDKAAIEQWTHALNEATKHLAELMMNRSVRAALAGKNVEDVE